MSASPYRWEPSSVGTQASGNVTDSGFGQDKSDAAGKSDDNSGPRQKPGGGKY
ncbi:hypothetical protein AGABI2DRAFT_194702 [Agaricus bisporus var. bisporus H97]|uniref:hypothetical protein n=1 Tax=Agaricus bisporus var. bisporus (strain H97 / ATCC MYA-4626 / FGSC 10389) TaxID=936046 RepID=UPI00029F4EE4|nr:hypothetical protein AGABI2DRAFT_194702 [Agaricus bisporus var. bisporus H97]EKV44810.1 hypothetical protein AGABI2DRAFT_194702 [Agaricus bisporus var. bisporus H97]